MSIIRTRTLNDRLTRSCPRTPAVSSTNSRTEFHHRAPAGPRAPGRADPGEAAVYYPTVTREEFRGIAWPDHRTWRSKPEAVARDLDARLRSPVENRPRDALAAARTCCATRANCSGPGWASRKQATQPSGPLRGGEGVRQLTRHGRHCARRPEPAPRFFRRFFGDFNQGAGRSESYKCCFAPLRGACTFFQMTAGYQLAKRHEVRFDARHGHRLIIF